MTRPTKTCQHCGKVYEKSPRRGIKDWESRRFCGHACTSAYRRGLPPTTPVQTKICELCGTEYQRRPKVGNKDWEARQFCSHVCADASRRKPKPPKPAKPAKPAQPTKTCAGCGRVFERPKGITHKRWEVRQFCGGVCRNAAQQPPPAPVPKPRPVKKCEQCGELFERPRDLDDARWEKRRYCTKDCQWAVTRPAGVAASPVTSPGRKAPHAPTHTHPTPSAPPQRHVWRPANIGRDMRPRVDVEMTG